MSNSISNLPPPWPNMAQALSKYTIELKEAKAEENRRSGNQQNVQDSGASTGDTSGQNGNTGNEGGRDGGISIEV